MNSSALINSSKKSRSNNNSNSSKKTQSKNKNEEILYPHQQDVINRIVYRCETQKGLIIYHEMGTGKTKSTINIVAELYKKDIYPVKIFCEPKLVGIWENEISNIDERIKRNIVINDYSQLFTESNFTDTIIIVDEAHHLSEIIKKNDNEINKNFIDRIKKSKKFLLLTGTPIYNSLIDISILINLVAMTQVISYNPNEFDRKYINITDENKFFYGWVIPKLHGFVISNMKKYKETKVISTFLRFLQHIIKNPFSLENIISSILQITNIKYDILFFIILSFVIYIAKMKDVHGIKQIAKHGVHERSIYDDFAPYIDFYKPENNVLPRKIFQNIYVQYDIEQIEHWYHFLFGIIIQPERFNEYYKTNTENLKFFSKDFDKSQYIDKGRLIGNTNKNNDPPKFVQLLQFIKNHQNSNHLIYSNFYEFGTLRLSHYFQQNALNHFVLHYDVDQHFREEIFEKFANNEINVLLLHYNYTEGFSIKNTQYFHILEPVLQFSKYEQIIGRAVRLNSHNNLPKNARIVNIINWISVGDKKILGDIYGYVEMKVMLRNFFGFAEEKIDETRIINEYYTPDELAYNSMEDLIVFKNVLEKILTKYQKPCANSNIIKSNNNLSPNKKTKKTIKNKIEEKIDDNNSFINSAYITKISNNNYIFSTQFPSYIYSKKENPKMIVLEFIHENKIKIDFTLISDTIFDYIIIEKNNSINNSNSKKTNNNNSHSKKINNIKITFIDKTDNTKNSILTKAFTTSYKMAKNTINPLLNYEKFYQYIMRFVLQIFIKIFHQREEISFSNSIGVLLYEYLVTNSKIKFEFSSKGRKISKTDTSILATIFTDAAKIVKSYYSNNINNTLIL